MFLIGTAPWGTVEPYSHTYVIHYILWPWRLFVAAQVPPYSSTVIKHRQTSNID
jgi:hypothetical protein